MNDKEEKEESIYTDPYENSLEIKESNREIEDKILFKNNEDYTKKSNEVLTNFTSRNKHSCTNSNFEIGSVYEDFEKEYFNFDINESIKKEINRKKEKENSVKINNYKYNGLISLSQRNKVYSSNSLTISSSLKINSIIFHLKESDINLNFLKTKLRLIPVKIKNISKTENRHFKNLIELQNFYIDDCPIRVIKLSYDNNFLATGNKKGIIKLFEIMNYEYENFESSYTEKEILSYLNFLNEKPKLILNEHTNDIIDLSFSPLNYSYLLSASLDNYVILWNIKENKNNIIKKFKHNDMVTSISFHPFNENIFISGSLDHFIRIFNINENCKYDYFNIEEKVTCVNFFPSGDSIAIGTHNGKIKIYNIYPKISYNCSFSVKNKLGKNSLGKKVTNIEFINRNSALISTCDSRIRYVTMPHGKLIYKYKGLVNENKMIRASSNFNYDLIISGSENGFCYIWNRNNLEDKNKKNYHYEFFKPFAQDICECSIFVNENCMTKYLKKIFKLTCNFFIISIIINATDKGRIQVLLNVDNCKK